tara:strand:- start:71 stop:283 length:213 start_codon:yes stop_codon:yes gene_type:complete
MESEILGYTEEEIQAIIKMSWASGAHTSLHNALNHIKEHRNEKPDCTMDSLVDLLQCLVDVSKEMKDGGS